MAFHCVRCNKELDPTFKACPHCGEPINDFTREYSDKPIDGKYRILARLGAGGMGDVYKVEHTYLGAIRVIKVVRPQISDSGEAHDRFLREARLATKVHHANVATLHDFAALPDGSHYMVWEFIEGENLAQVMRRRGNIPPRTAVEITRQALAGLDAIHRAGIVHRDISPENLMITTDADGNERVKIIDLGVAKGDDSEVSMTKTGIFVGKLRYCSPEHLGFLPDGEKIDGRADLYSLAIVLVEMLTGRPPFEATSPHQYILHHSRDTMIKPVDVANVPEGLQPVIARSLERDRNKRYANAREFSEALGKVELPAQFDADATMRLTPPPDALTIRTPLPNARTEIDTSPTPPARPPAVNAATVATPMATVPAMPIPAAPAAAPIVAAPAPPPSIIPPSVIAPAPGSRSAAPLIIVILLLLVVIAAGAGYFVLHKPEPTVTSTVAQTTTTATQTATPVPQPQSTMNVTAPPETQTTVTTSTTATAPIQIVPAPQPVAPPQPRVQPAPVPAPVPQVQPPATDTAEGEESESPKPADADPTEGMGFPTYTEGGSSMANESALHVAQMNLKHVTRVTVLGGGDPALLAELRNLLSDRGLSVVDDADVIIRFHGMVERLGRGGRKRRFARATITRNGRPVLRYVLPNEAYRVGDNPAEAFARILADAFNQ